jgi:peptidoglycan/xylan/chitin deacetylase (PgdA/CDA1 family)
VLFPAAFAPGPAATRGSNPLPVALDAAGNYRLHLLPSDEIPGPVLPGLALAAEGSQAPPSPPPPAEPAPAPVRKVFTREKVVALTFDDGPHHLTEAYLAVLSRAGVRATFFLVGSRVSRYPELAKRIAEAGHEVANHSLYHARAGARTQELLRAELDEANLLLEKTAGARPALFRPPYGEKPETLLQAAAAAGLTTVAWSVDPRDWDDPPPGVIVDRVLEEIHPGAIVILHEGHPHTLEALPQLLGALGQHGYRFLTVSELIALGSAPPSRP